MNYLHLLAMTKDFQLDWPDTFTVVSSSAASGSFFSVNIVPFQCLLRFDYFQRLGFFLLLPAAGVVLPFAWYGVVFCAVGLRKSLCGSGEKGVDDRGTGSRGNGASSASSNRRANGGNSAGVAQRASQNMHGGAVDPVEVTLDHNGGVVVRRPAFLVDRVSDRRTARYDPYV